MFSLVTPPPSFQELMIELSPSVCGLGMDPTAKESSIQTFKGR